MATEAVTWQELLGRDRLIVSGFGKWGGGVYDLTGGRPRALDDLPTSGMAVGGGRLWRVLRAPGEQTSTCELLSYDERGVATYQRLDAIRDPHDVRWHDGAVHVTSSWDDAVWRVTAAGPELVWRGSTVPDGWHVNSLTVDGGRLHVCAFGRHGRHKAWKTSERKDTGFVRDLVAGRDVLTGLFHPHTPRRAGDRWYVCESTKGALTELDAHGAVVRRAAIKRFTRGLALVGPWALVGGNAHRDHDGDRAEVAVVDLRTFEVVDRIGMPCLEIYEILAVPPDLARGLATGFGANPARAVEQHRSADRPDDLNPTPAQAVIRLVPPAVAEGLARMGQELGLDDARRCQVRGGLPATAVAGSVGSIRLDVVNRSRRLLGSVGPMPVKIGARWFRLADGQRDDTAVTNPMVPLPHVLHRGQRLSVDVPLEVPDEPGRYEVRVALRQSTIGWFGVRVEATVEVVSDRAGVDRRAPAPRPIAGRDDVPAPA